MLGIARRSGVLSLTTHTPRHLRLTDLARSNWDLLEIAAFAGHRNTQTTVLYIHLSGRELAAKLERGMAEIHSQRIRLSQLAVPAKRRGEKERLRESRQKGGRWVVGEERKSAGVTGRRKPKELI